MPGAWPASLRVMLQLVLDMIQRLDAQAVEANRTSRVILRA